MDESNIKPGVATGDQVRETCHAKAKKFALPAVKIGLILLMLF